MGILDAYQDSTDTALRVMATQPLTPEPVTPKHSTWSAPFRAVAAGAAEVAGNVMDTAGAFGQVAAASGGLTPGFDPDAKKNRNATVEAFDKLKTEGINWRTDEAQQAYKFGADLRPDPLTAGTAENIVFGLTKGLTKAIGAAATLGPVGGAAAFGVSEGLTTAEDLANQGVDQQTRTKVGAVTGAMSAAGVVLPVAGKTLAQTAGLVVVGGPASFMAQQQATRSILENANYGEIAKQYDPLDPVGLTVATLLPAGFAAYAKRGGFGPRATPEAIDAAMVQNMTIARDVHQDTPAQKFEAELWRGPVTENKNFQTWFGDSKIVDTNGKPLIVYHGTNKSGKWGKGIDQFKQDENGLIFFSLTPKEANRFAEQGSEYKGKGGRGFPNVLPVYVKANNPFDYENQAHVSRLLKTARIPLGSDKAKAIAIGDYNELETRKIVSAIKKMGFDSMFVNEGYTGAPKNIAVFDPSQIKSAIGNSGKFDPNSSSLTDPIANDLTTSKRIADVKTKDSYAARVDALLKDHPDIVARLDDAGQPVKLADELTAIKKQAQEGTDTDFGALDAPLLKTAIECALSLGAA